MKTICLRTASACVFALTLLLSNFASAQNVERPFDFKVSSECAGCVSFSEFQENFQLITAGTPVRLRLYYTYSWYSQPDETAEYFELPIYLNPQTGKVEVPEITLGNFSTGSRYAFAYGLVSENGHLLWFMTEAEFDMERHSIEVQ